MFSASMLTLTYRIEYEAGWWQFSCVFQFAFVLCLKSYTCIYCCTVWDCVTCTTRPEVLLEGISIHSSAMVSCRQHLTRWHPTGGVHIPAALTGLKQPFTIRQAQPIGYPTQNWQVTQKLRCGHPNLLLIVFICQLCQLDNCLLKVCDLVSML